MSLAEMQGILLDALGTAPPVVAERQFAGLAVVESTAVRRGLKYVDDDGVPRHSDLDAVADANFRRLETWAGGHGSTYYRLWGHAATIGAVRSGTAEPVSAAVFERNIEEVADAPTDDAFTRLGAAVGGLLTNVLIAGAKPPAYAGILSSLEFYARIKGRKPEGHWLWGAHDLVFPLHGYPDRPAP